jgi:hypothetical protein
MTFMGSFKIDLAGGDKGAISVSNNTIYAGTLYYINGSSLNYSGGLTSVSIPSLSGTPAYDGSNAPAPNTTGGSTTIVPSTIQLDSSGNPIINFGAGAGQGYELTGFLEYNGKLYVSGGVWYDANQVQNAWITSVDTALTTWEVPNGALQNGAVLPVYGSTGGIRWLSAPLGTLPTEWQIPLKGKHYSAGGQGFSIASSLSWGPCFATFDLDNYNPAGGNIPINFLVGYTNSNTAIGRSPSGPFPQSVSSYPEYTMTGIPKAGDTSFSLTTNFNTFSGIGSLTAGEAQTGTGTGLFGTLTITQVNSGTISLGGSITNSATTPSSAIGVMSMEGNTGGVGTYKCYNQSSITYPAGTPIYESAIFGGHGIWWLIFDSGERRTVSMNFGDTTVSGFEPLTLDCTTDKVQIAPAGDNFSTVYDGGMGYGFIIPGTRTLAFISMHAYGFEGERFSNPCDTVGSASGSSSTPIAPDTTSYVRMQITMYDLKDLWQVGKGNKPIWQPTPIAWEEFPNWNLIQASCPSIGLGSFFFDYSTNILYALVGNTVYMWSISPVV